MLGSRFPAVLGAAAGMFVLLSLSTPHAGAQAGPHGRVPGRDEVRGLLSGIEDVPTDEQWQRIGPAVLPVLIALYNDASEAPYVRLRAVGATAAFPQPAVRTFLLAVAAAEGQSDLLVREAVMALGRGFGPRARAELIGFLEHPQDVVREAAARQLARIDDDVAREALRARLRIEPQPHVRAVLTRALH